MYKLMAYIEEWISLHEQWDVDRVDMLDAVDFSKEGWQGDLVVKHVMLRPAEDKRRRDRFIVLICDSLNTVSFVESSLLVRNC